jgi:hypothetical protein
VERVRWALQKYPRLEDPGLGPNQSGPVRPSVDGRVKSGEAMATPVLETNAGAIQEPRDFSLVLGGPLFQLYRMTHLSGDALEYLRRRIAVITLLAWLPLLVLSFVDGNALHGAIEIPFLYDMEAHARFLIALPLLIFAEIVVHERISPLMRRFVERKIVSEGDLPAFIEAVDSTLRKRNSLSIELTLLGLVYTLGIWIWRGQIALGAATWYAAPNAAHLNLTLAGYWYMFVSIPLFQFLLLRWYMRLALWFHLLWKVSKLNLHLVATHPDRAGGIGFLGEGSYAFGPILFAQGALLSGLIANRMLFEKQGLPSFEMEAAGYIGFFVLCVLGPLTMFTTRLDRAKRTGAAEYGLLANRYVFGFENKWVNGRSEDKDELLGTGDIQSLADLANSYAVVQSMRITPFGLNDVAFLAAMSAAPLSPLLLTVYSLSALLTSLFKILF